MSEFLWTSQSPMNPRASPEAWIFSKHLYNTPGLGDIVDLTCAMWPVGWHEEEVKYSDEKLDIWPRKLIRWWSNRSSWCLESLNHCYHLSHDCRDINAFSMWNQFLWYNAVDLQTSFPKIFFYIGRSLKKYFIICRPRWWWMNWSNGPSSIV